MSRTAPRIVLVPVAAALTLLGGCFLPGGTAPDGCDLEPNDSVFFARGLAYDTEALSCNDGGTDTDLYRLGHIDAASEGIYVQCSGGTGATLEVDLLPDDGPELLTGVVPAFTCNGNASNPSAMPAGTLYLRVFHPDPSSVDVTVQASLLN